MKVPKVYNVYLTAFTSTIGGLLFGFDISSMSATIGTHQYLDFFHHPSSTQQGGITAAMPGGSFLGALSAGWFSDRFGRRTSIQFSCLMWILGTAISCSSTGIPMLVVGRFISGLCIGITSSQCPVYLAELSKRSIRGRVVGIQQWSIEWGCLIMYFIGYGCSFLPGHASFRVPWGLMMLPAIFLFLILPIFPESPRWLVSKGRREEALEVLAHVQANGNRDDPDVLLEYNDIVAAHELELESTYSALFKPGSSNRTFIAVMTQVWQQLAGGNIMMYYVVYVFQMAGLSGNINLISSSIQYVLLLVFTVPTLFYIDSFGRRKLLLLGYAGMGFFIFLVGIILGARGKHVDSAGGNANIKLSLQGDNGATYAVLVCSYLFIVVYSLTLAPTAWIYAPEVLAMHTRGKGMGLASAGNWAMNFALAFGVPPAMQSITYGTFLLFGGFNVIAFVHTFLAFPETARKSLEEIDMLFAPGGPPAWRTKPGSIARADAIEKIETNMDEKADGEIVHQE